MSNEDKRSTPGERPVSLGEVIDRVGGAFRAAGFHPYYVVVPGEAPGEQHVAVCLDAYAAATCLHGAWAAGKAPQPDTKA